IDRMVTQLMLQPDFAGVRGVVLGQFTRCDEQDPDSAWNVRQVLTERLSDLGIPVVAGWAIGHVLNKLTVPLGVRAELDSGTLSLKVLESAVRD
ncbi:MAG: hypothetical protein MH204_03080, partial [Fimbriimonadaceae bacterium]|nr:hypothetical protein [Fimbriimonadaceae bacterium]